MVNKILRMLGFKLRISGVRNKCATNCATTTALQLGIFVFLGTRLYLRIDCEVMHNHIILVEKLFLFTVNEQREKKVGGVQWPKNSWSALRLEPTTFAGASLFYHYSCWPLSVLPRLEYLNWKDFWWVTNQVPWGFSSLCLDLYIKKERERERERVGVMDVSVLI